MALDSEEIKRRQRAMWSTGDYPEIAALIQVCADDTVAAVGVQSGETLLDVATGSGNAAIAATRRGARVTGLDLTPELLEVAKARAAAEGVEIAFQQGDAEHLPYADGSFDRVTSVFGAMFAPDQERTAAELLRVVRPGGTVAVAAWTPEGLNGQMFATVAKHMPPPPEGFKPPILWGVEDVVRGLFGSAEEVNCARCEASDSVSAESADAWVSYLERVLGPAVMAKAALEPEGRWEALRADLVTLYESSNAATDGTMLAHPEYLLTVARKAV